MTNKGLLLDTHVWIWLNEGSAELKPKIISLINETSQHQGIFISAISIWEIATLASKKRLILQTTLDDWINQALNQPGVELVPLLPSIAIESTCLPDSFHGDPADRIITATARTQQLSLVTRDHNILEYAKKGYLTTVKA